jgi:glutathione S-transferase
MPPKQTTTSKVYDYSGLEKGMRMQAESEGTYYAAEVVVVSTSKNRAKAPVKVAYKGYEGYDEWVGGDRLRSKALKVVTPEKAKAKAKVKVLAAGDVKLYYWPARGRGEQVRLALAATSTSFEDVTFDMTDEAAKGAFFEKCRELGGNLTNNTPMLELGGKFYTQSTAIVKLVCARGGLAARGGAYEVDNVIAHVEDLRSICYKPIKLLGGTMEKDEFLKLSEKHLKNLERLLGDKSNFVNSRMTAADICVYDLLDTMVETQVPGHLASNFPKLAAFRERMGQVKEIAAYHETEQHKKLWAFPAI